MAGKFWRLKIQPMSSFQVHGTAIPYTRTKTKRTTERGGKGGGEYYEKDIDTKIEDLFWHWLNKKAVLGPSKYLILLSFLRPQSAAVPKI